MMTETPHNVPGTKDFQVTGVSRSGRVRKKSSKLLDFQSPDEVEKKPKRSTPRQARISGGSGSGNGRGRPSLASLRARKALNELDSPYDIGVDDDDLFPFVDAVSLSAAEATAAIDNSFVVSGTGDSDDDLDQLVAGIVRGVEAESLEHTSGTTNSKVRQSLYMTEKSNKRKMLKDGKVVTGKVERKDKGKSRYTAYSMWARESRKTAKFNKGLDFSNTARRLGEMWANVSNKEKGAWRRKAKIQATKAKAHDKSYIVGGVSPSAVLNTNAAFYNRATTSRTKKLAAERQKTPPAPQINAPLRITPIPNTATKRKRYNSYKSGAANAVVPAGVTEVIYGSGSQAASLAYAQHPHHQMQMSGTEAIDAAAHLKLLGESLTIIGERLKEHEGQIAISGSLSVLLDSLLCSMGPLLCLTKYLPGLQKVPRLNANLAATLDNIAYVMPGL